MDEALTKLLFEADAGIAKLVKKYAVFDADDRLLHGAIARDDLATALDLLAPGAALRGPRS
ncbi:hypothetical protein [Mesorhizobium sp. M0491]|uniref:hypothetical protein n=1 Tax=Mesorhizobium sp. M0491 TaxID=2956950 RepID=UPI00333D4083